MPVKRLRSRSVSHIAEVLHTGVNVESISVIDAIWSVSRMSERSHRGLRQVSRTRIFGSSSAQGSLGSHWVAEFARLCDKQIQFEIIFKKIAHEGQLTSFYGIAIPLVRLFPIGNLFAWSWSWRLRTFLCVSIWARLPGRRHAGSSAYSRPQQREGYGPVPRR